MSYRLLIVDQDPGIRVFLSNLFSREGLSVAEATEGTEALKKAIEIQPQLIILEVTLNKMDGIELCTELRNNPAVNGAIIIFYTSRSEDYSQVAGFNAGADDYIIKPVRPAVLIPRIKALLKRKYFSSERKPVPVQGLMIDRDRYIVYKDSRPLVLPRKEFELLALLFSAPRKVFSRQELTEKIWDYHMSPRNRTIDVHIRKLREKLGDAYIKTVKGVGYSLEI